MDKTVICVYSGTGNTLSLAKRFNGAEILDIIRINEGREELPEDTVRLGIFFLNQCAQNMVLMKMKIFGKMSF